MTTTTLKTMLATTLGLAMLAAGAPMADACTAPTGSGPNSPSAIGGDSPFGGTGNDAMASRSSGPSATVHTHIDWHPVRLKVMPALTGNGERYDDVAAARAEERHLRR